MKTRYLRVSEFAEIYSGGTPSTGNPDYWDGDVAWVTPKDLSAGTGVYIGHGERFITEQGLSRSSARLLPADTVILSSRAPVGYVAIAKSPLATNQGCKNLRCKNGVAHPLYVYYLLKNSTSVLESHATGSTYKELSSSRLKNITFPLPENIADQVLIASILSTYDRAIENNRRRIALLEKAVRLVYQEWFINLRFPGHQRATFFNGFPRGWERKRIGEIAPFRYGRSLKIDSRIPGEFPVYGSSGVIGTHKESLVPGPGIIVGRKGNVGSVFWSQRDFYPIDTVYYVDPSDSSLFLYHALRNTQFINTDVAVPGLNRKLAHSKTILIPDRVMIDIFEQYATANYQQVDHLTKCNDALEKARDLLLPLLMNGRISV